MEWLIKNGANIKVKSNDGVTPLMIACCYDHKKVVELLLENGANKNTKDDDDKTALFYAEEYCNKEIANLLKN